MQQLYCVALLFSRKHVAFLSLKYLSSLLPKVSRQYNWFYLFLVGTLPEFGRTHTEFLFKQLRKVFLFFIKAKGYTGTYIILLIYDIFNDEIEFCLFINFRLNSSLI